MSNVSMAPTAAAPAPSPAPGAPTPSAPATPAPPPAPATPAERRSFTDYVQQQQGQQGDAAPPVENQPPPLAPTAEPPLEQQAESPIDETSELTDEEWQTYEAARFAERESERFDPASLNLDEIAQDPAQLRSVTEQLLQERESQQSALALGQTLMQVAGEQGYQGQEATVSQVLQDLLNPMGVFDHNGNQYRNGQRLGMMLNRHFPQAAQAVTLDTMANEPGFVEQFYDHLLQGVARDPRFNETFVPRSAVQPFLDSDLQTRVGDFLTKIPQDLHETFLSLKPAVQKDMLERGLEVALDDLTERKENGESRAAQRAAEQEKAQQIKVAKNFNAEKQTHGAQMKMYRQLVADAKAAGWSELEARGIAAIAWEEVEDSFYNEDSQWRPMTMKLQSAYRDGDTPAANRILGEFQKALSHLYTKAQRAHVRPATVRSKLRGLQQPKQPVVNGAQSNGQPQFAPTQPPGGPRGQNGQYMPFNAYHSELFGG